MYVQWSEYAIALLTALSNQDHLDLSELKLVSGPDQVFVRDQLSSGFHFKENAVLSFVQCGQEFWSLSDTLAAS